MTVYLDTSSLVKLFCEEAGSKDVRSLVASATIATSVVAYPGTRVTSPSDTASAAFDSIHLACFASLASQGDLAAVRFSSFDESLNRAAEALRKSAGR